MNKIRRSQKGDLALELKTNTEHVVERFNTKIESSANGDVNITTRISERLQRQGVCYTKRMVQSI